MAPNQTGYSRENHQVAHAPGKLLEQHCSFVYLPVPVKSLQWSAPRAGRWGMRTEEDGPDQKVRHALLEIAKLKHSEVNKAKKACNQTSCGPKLGQTHTLAETCSCSS
jgi:hypothetical protein